MPAMQELVEMHDEPVVLVPPHPLTFDETEHRGRQPDVVFVHQERADIVQEKGIYSAPDLVIEILSPGDEAADGVALETDYRSQFVKCRSPCCTTPVNE